MGEDGVSDVFIYERDVKWLAEADFVVAEVTQPSLGVGYELGYAEAHRKPTLCLFRPSSGTLTPHVKDRKSRGVGWCRALTVGDDSWQCSVHIARLQHGGRCVGNHN